MSSLLSVDTFDFVNVLFLTAASLKRQPFGDASTRYRCFNVAEVLRSQGHRADVMELRGLPASTIDAYDIVSVLRPAQSGDLSRVIERGLQRHTHLVADFDDLLFDPDQAEHAPMVVNAQASASFLRRRFTLHRQALGWFDQITVSSTPLLEAVRALDPHARVEVVANGLSAHALNHWQRHFRSSSGKHPIASYLPGSRSHDADFASIRKPLFEWLETRPDRRLRLIGQLDASRHDIPPSLRERIECASWMDYHELGGCIASSRVTLAPLLNNVFNQAKSHIKFIESAAMGVPLIASAIPDLARHQVEGLMFAHNENDWQVQLDRLEDAAFRDHCATELRAYALQHAMASQTCEALIRGWTQGQGDFALDDEHRAG